MALQSVSRAHHRVRLSALMVNLMSVDNVQPVLRAHLVLPERLRAQFVRLTKSLPLVPVRARHALTDKVLLR